jgi:integrase
MNIFDYLYISLKINNMSALGTITTSDYIQFDRATTVGEKLLKDEKLKTLGLYIIVSINSGLRISDVLALKGENLKADTIKLTEKKTNNKHREIKINENIKKAIKQYGTLNDGYLFVSQKKTVYSIQSVNRLLKSTFKKEAKTLNISTHSMRKSFGRKVYESCGESEKALNYLSELFNHTSLSVTRRYLGIRQEELNNIYDCIA